MVVLSLLCLNPDWSLSIHWPVSRTNASHLLWHISTTLFSCTWLHYVFLAKYHCKTQVHPFRFLWVNLDIFHSVMVLAWPERNIFINVNTCMLRKKVFISRGNKYSMNILFLIYWNVAQSYICIHNDCHLKLLDLVGPKFSLTPLNGILVRRVNVLTIFFKIEHLLHFPRLHLFFSIDCSASRMIGFQFIRHIEYATSIPDLKIRNYLNQIGVLSFRKLLLHTIV